MGGDELLRGNPLMVVDVGASGGLHRRWRGFTDCYRAILFEPDPREYRRLKQRYGDNCVVLNSAVSSRKETLNFNLCRKRQVSSAFEPNYEFLSCFPNVERYSVTKTIQIQSDSLQSQLRRSGIPEVDFIKLDTQGYELAILEGSNEYLANVIGLEIEVEYASVYSGQPLFSDVDSFVRDAGFTLFDIKNHYWRRRGYPKLYPARGQLIFGDALYFRTPEMVLGRRGISEKKIVRAFCIYLVYECGDVAKHLAEISAERGLISGECYGKMCKLISSLGRKSFVDRLNSFLKGR